MSLLSIQVKRWQLPLLYVARKIVSQSIQVWKKGIPLLYSNVHYLVSVYESSSLKVDGISSFLHVFTSRQTWNRFVQECQHLRMESGLRSRNCCVFSLWKLTRNYSWNTKVATLSWSAVQIPMLSVWFGKESTMLSLQTIKKWSDARLRKALPGWSLDYTRASSHPKLSSCPQFL